MIRIGQEVTVVEDDSLLFGGWRGLLQISTPTVFYLSKSSSKSLITWLTGSLKTELDYEPLEKMMKKKSIISLIIVVLLFISINILWGSRPQNRNLLYLHIPLPPTPEVAVK